MNRPDYDGGGIVNLMASVQRGMARDSAAEAPFVAAAALEPGRVAAARHVLLLVIDGLGYDWLMRHGRGALREHTVARLSSVFPSTTAAAITTFFTARSPLQHGLTGWFTNIEPLPSVVAPLPFNYRDGPSLLEAGVTPAQCFSTPPLFPSLARECHVVHPAFLIGSPYNSFHARGAVEHGYEDLNGLFETTRELLLEARAPARYVYAYWPELDRLSHRFGCESRAARRHLAALEEAFERFLAALRGSGCLLLVTADHGFVDTRDDTRLPIADYPALVDTLRLPLCGEPRAVICHLRAGAETAFDACALDTLGARATVMSGEQMVADGWFGHGPAHPHMATRAGDRVLLMHDDFVIDDQRTGEHVHVGEHGGVSAAEMFVPLVCVPA